MLGVKAMFLAISQQRIVWFSHRFV